MCENNTIEKRIQELQVEITEHEKQIKVGKNHINQHTTAAISKNGAIVELKKLCKTKEGLKGRVEAIDNGDE